MKFAVYKKIRQKILKKINCTNTKLCNTTAILYLLSVLKIRSSPKEWIKTSILILRDTETHTFGCFINTHVHCSPYSELENLMYIATEGMHLSCSVVSKRHVT